MAATSRARDRGASTYVVHGVTVTSTVALPAPRRAKRGGDISIDVAHATPETSVEFFHSWRTGGAGRSRRWLEIGRRAGGYLLRFPELADFDVSADGSHIRCRPTRRLAASTLGHLLLDQVLPLALSRQGRLALHASAVHVPRLGCVVFAGPTGSGKSTLATALGVRGGQVVSDDCLVVEPDSCRAVPGSPWVRLWRDAATRLGLKRAGSDVVAHYTTKRRFGGQALRFRSRPSPIVAIAVLAKRTRRARAVDARLLAPRDRLIALAPYVFVMDVEDPRQLAQMFRDLAALVAAVPVVRLRATDDRRQLAETAREVISLAHALASPAAGKRR